MSQYYKNLFNIPENSHRLRIDRSQALAPSCSGIRDRRILWGKRSRYGSLPRQRCLQNSRSLGERKSLRKQTRICVKAHQSRRRDKSNGWRCVERYAPGGINFARKRLGPSDLGEHIYGFSQQASKNPDFR